MVAAAVLLLNDHVLKQAHPGFVTGKLSDVAGLVAAAPLVALIFLRRADLAATLLTGTLFTLVKTTQTGAETASQVWSLLAGPSRVLADPTDLLALPALALAWWLRRRTLRADSRRWRMLVATPLTVLLGALASGMRRLRVPYQLCALVASGAVLFTALVGFSDRSPIGVVPDVVVYGGGVAALATLACLALAMAGDTTGTALLIGLGGAVAAYGSVYGPFHGWTVGVPDSHGVAVTAAVVLTLGVLAAMATLLDRHARARAARTAHPRDGAGGPGYYFGGSSTSSPT